MQRSRDRFLRSAVASWTARLAAGVVCVVLLACSRERAPAHTYPKCAPKWVFDEQRCEQLMSSEEAWSSQAPTAAPRECLTPVRVMHSVLIDTDYDGYDNRADSCPYAPEDFDGFEDDDGCPDCDNDGDGVPDSDALAYEHCQSLYKWYGYDECPDAPAGADDSANGCPASAPE